MGSPALTGMPTLRVQNPLFYSEFQYCTSNVLGFDPIVFPWCPDIIKLTGGLTGYTGTDAESMFFNQDQGANYWDRSVIVASPGSGVAEVPTANSNLIRFGNPTNKGRVFDITIFNFLSKSKVVMVNNQIGTGAAGTPAEINCGAGGEWLNTLAQIRRIDFQTAGGAVKILAGSTLLVQAWAGMHN